MKEYVERLLADGRMRVVEREVDPRFELAAVTVASQRESDAPILFRNVRGARVPVVSNVFGSRPRLGELIGAIDGRFCPRWAELTHNLAATAELPAARIDAAYDAVRLADLPHITYAEKDAGPYVTAGIFLAKEPDTGVPNLSFHRAMMVGEHELRVRLGRTHDLTRYQAKAEARGDALEAAILIGPSPHFVLAAAAPLRYDESEVECAARLAGERVPTRRCVHIDLDVPVDADVVIEGRFLPHLRRAEAPFGEFQGYYVGEVQSHVFEVLGVTVRRGGYFHALVCGSPEDLRLLELGVATRVYRHLADVLPGIVDVACVPHVMSTVVQIRQQYEGHARQVLLSAVGSNHDWNKTVMVVDDDVDLDDFTDVWWAFLTRARPDERVTVIPEVPGFFRDPHRDHWGRLLIDATRPFGRAGEYERKRVPGADTIRLSEYLARQPARP
jgi:4-hydroxybenzoate decarboxylase